MADTVVTLKLTSDERHAMELAMCLCSKQFRDNVDWWKDFLQNADPNDCVGYKIATEGAEHAKNCFEALESVRKKLNGGGPK